MLCVGFSSRSDEKLNLASHCFFPVPIMVINFISVKLLQIDISSITIELDYVVFKMCRGMPIVCL